MTVYYASSVQLLTIHTPVNWHPNLLLKLVFFLMEIILCVIHPVMQPGIRMWLNCTWVTSLVLDFIIFNPDELLHISYDPVSNVISPGSERYEFIWIAKFIWRANLYLPSHRNSSTKSWNITLCDNFFWTLSSSICSMNRERESEREIGNKSEGRG